MRIELSAGFELDHFGAGWINTTLPMTLNRGFGKPVIPFRPNQLGTYNVQILGKASCTYNPDKPEDCANEQFEVVSDNSGFYVTTQAAPFLLEIVSPDPSINNEVHGLAEIRDHAP